MSTQATERLIEVHQESQAVLTQTAEVEHGERGRTCLPNDCCDTCLVERLVGGPSCWAEQAANYMLKACAIAFELDWGFSLEGD